MSSLLPTKAVAIGLLVVSLWPADVFRSCQADSRNAQPLARVAGGATALQATYPDRQVSIAAFFRLQGESDAKDPTLAAAYSANPTGLIAAIPADLNLPRLPVYADNFPIADRYNDWPAYPYRTLLPVTGRIVTR